MLHLSNMSRSSSKSAILARWGEQEGHSDWRCVRWVRTCRSAEDTLKQKVQFLKLASVAQWGQFSIVRVEGDGINCVNVMTKLTFMLAIVRLWSWPYCIVTKQRCSCLLQWRWMVGSETDKLMWPWIFRPRPAVQGQDQGQNFWP